MVSFEYPYAFILILIFILGALFFKLRDDALIFPEIKTHKNKQSIALFITKWLGLISLIVALCMPYKKDLVIDNTKPSHSIITILDTSGSMHSIHTKENGTTWFDTAKQMATEFLEKRDGDHLGIVLFGTYAYAAAPLSYDTKSVANVMRTIKGGIAGESTSMNDAIFIASRMASKSKAKQNIAILISDGKDESSISTLDDAINFANDAKLKIYSIYVGRSLRSLSLQKLAEGTGGKFYYAKDDDTLQKVYKDIDTIEKSDLKTKSDFKKSYIFEYFLWFGFINLVLYFILNKKRGINL